MIPIEKLASFLLSRHFSKFRRIWWTSASHSGQWQVPPLPMVHSQEVGTHIRGLRSS